MELPYKLTNMNMWISSELTGVKSFAGICSEITLPVISFKTDEHFAAGQDGPIEIVGNMEAMEASFSMSSTVESEIFKACGFGGGNPVQVIVRGSLKRDDSVIPVNAVISGSVKNIDMGSWKLGDESSIKFTMTVNFYSLHNGNPPEELCYIDLKSTIRRFGGIDQLQAVREALNI